MKTPALFIGHGSPMNAIEENAFTKKLRDLGQKMPKPEVIVCISAHWLTTGTWVTSMKNPRTIHDFSGFPQALHEVNYPAKGSARISEIIQSLSRHPQIQSDETSWGLDHGTWSVLIHMYPQADVPVVQLSIDMTKPAEFHFEIGQKLKPLREQGVLILGSGNIVHNLGRINFRPNAKPYDWAVEFDEWAKEKLLARDDQAMIHDFHKTNAGKLSIPSLDHYLPLLYVLGASDKNERLRFEYESLELSSISMRSISLGL